MQICVPPNIDLSCGLVLIFLCGLLSVSEDTDYSKLQQTKVSSSKFAKIYFTFNTAVVTAKWASKNFEWSKTDYSLQLHNHTFKCLGHPDRIESSPYLQDILAYQ